jgi:large subunit ribosomal protein L29
MKIEEIRAIGSEELAKKLEVTRQDLFNLRLRLSTKQLVNHREIPRVKKDIARIESILKERAIQSEQVE